MDFSKAYNRQEFIKFLHHFLPEDLTYDETPIELKSKMTYTKQATKLGTSASLDLVVYEVRHNSTNDARVTLSKEAFRMLADEMEDRALVIFIPENNDSNYRFSLIEITLESTNESSRATRKYSNPHRYSYFLGEGIAYYTPNKYLNEKGRVVTPEDLRSRFSVEVLTKEFYQELSDWNAWAIKIIRFPNDLNDKTDDDKFNNESAIRLITRLIFVWFLKQRHLVPDEFFDEQYITDHLIKDFNPHTRANSSDRSVESKYYKAILQNLFFAMLNSPITPEGGSKELSERHFRNGRYDYDNNKLMRYEYYFKNPQLFVDLANQTVPFLNGGLFDCLDNKDKNLYYDGFSDREAVRKSLIVPDYLFFGEEAGKNIDLSEWYGSKKKKKVSARGIVDILKRYNFTVEENTPFDQEVSLDPELLGKVFENLLASYNPETQTTARKQTGSFYTPREIVQYMVDESLVAHLKRTVGNDLEKQYRQLMQYTDEEISLTDDQRKQIMQSIYHCKVLDPACGSGAFPMGMLQQMVHILNRIDPNNMMWREMMRKVAIDKTSEAYLTASDEERNEIINDIERSFNENVNRPDYARKLYLIENCIYGVDIQPIAIQISKLRFFISLVVDQKTNTDPTDNFGIRPLPNLEAKFVAANTLIELEKKDATLFDTDEIRNKKDELRLAKHKIFYSKYKTKRKYRQIVNNLRLEIAEMLESYGVMGNAEAKQLASWDMFDQNVSSPFFDSEWMFNVKNGFDIVIGNPPYVLIPAKLYKQLYSTYYNWQEGKIDLYRLFIEFSVKHLVNDKGILVFITPNSFLTIPSCKLLRKKLIELTHFIFIDNYDLTVFNSVSVNNVVFGLTKLHSNEKCKIVLHEDKHKTINYTDQASFQNNSGFEIYISIQKNDVQIINKIKNNSSIALNQYNIQICLGEQPYHNSIHTSEEIKSKFLHSKTQINNNYLLEYGGKNIIRFGIKRQNDNWLNYSGNLYTKPEFKFFHNPRIILREIIGKQLIATYTEDTFLVNKSCYIILSKNNDTYFLKYLLGILSSTLIGYYIQNLGDKSKQRLFPRITMSTLKNIPIIKDTHVMKQIINIVDECLYKKEQNIEENIINKEIELDTLIYHLYSLTYDEVLTVDPQTLITREEYEKKQQ